MNVLFRRLVKRRREYLAIASAGRGREEGSTVSAKLGAERQGPLLPDSSDTGQSDRHALMQPFCIVAELLGVLFAGVVAISWSYTEDAALFPTIIGSVGVCLCAVFLITAMIEPDFVTMNIQDMEKRSGDSRGFWVAFISPPLYCLGIDIFGFHVATFVAIVCMPAMLGYRRYLRLTLIALGGVALLHIVFVSAVQIDLPNGFVGDFLLKRFVYQP